MKVYIVIDCGCVCGVYASKVDAHRAVRALKKLEGAGAGLTAQPFYDVLERTVVKKSARKLP